ncbi:MAG: hypothetical protein ABJC89_06335 [Acidobacteriota bacterium]
MRRLPWSLAAVLCLAAQTAAAQTYRPDRPYRGLFAPPNPDAHHQLDVSWSAATAYDGNITVDSGLAASPATAVDGGWGSAELTGKYEYRGRHATLHASVFGRDRYYPKFEKLSAVDHGADLGFTTNVTGTTRISASQALIYQPFYQLSLVTNVASLEPSPGLDPIDSLSKTQSRSYSGATEISQRLGAASAVVLGYGYRYTQLPGTGAAPFQSQLITGTFTRTLTRRVSFRLGSGTGRTEGGLNLTSSPADTTLPGRRVTTRNLEVGLDYARPLSRSRHTTYSFASGAGTVTDLGVSAYRLMFDGGVTRELGRAWATGATYHRGLGFIDGIAAPTYADAAHLRLGGLISKRYDLNFAAAYSKGQIGLVQDRGGFTTYSGTADFRIALTRGLSIVAGYTSYRYSFDEDVAVAPGLEQARHRQSVRIGLSGWLPIVR